MIPYNEQNIAPPAYGQKPSEDSVAIAAADAFMSIFGFKRVQEGESECDADCEKPE